MPGQRRRLREGRQYPCSEFGSVAGPQGVAPAVASTDLRITGVLACDPTRCAARPAAAAAAVAASDRYIVGIHAHALSLIHI